MLMQQVQQIGKQREGKVARENSVGAVLLYIHICGRRGQVQPRARGIDFGICIRGIRRMIYRGCAIISRVM